jgi:hypothetical protein
MSIEFQNKTDKKPENIHHIRLNLKFDLTFTIHQKKILITFAVQINKAFVHTYLNKKI